MNEMARAERKNTGRDHERNSFQDRIPRQAPQVLRTTTNHGLVHWPYASVVTGRLWQLIVAVLDPDKVCHPRSSWLDMDDRHPGLHARGAVRLLKDSHFGHVQTLAISTSTG